MADPRTVLALLAGVSLAGLGAVFFTVWDAGSTAAWRGDTETVGTAILLLVLVIVVVALVGLARGDR